MQANEHHPLEMTPSIAEIKTSLHTHFNALSDPATLSVFLKTVNSTDLQQFMHEQIGKMDSKTAKSLYYDACPVDRVLPEDVIQHILSFENVHHNRAVCELWNRLNQQNEEKIIRTTHRSIMSRNSEPPSEIWVLHRKRPALHPIEVQFGYHGLRHVAPEILRKSAAGAVILVYGEHMIYDFSFNDNADDSVDFNETSFVGVEPSSSMWILSSNKSGNVSFEKLLLKTRGFKVSGEGSKISIKYCNIEVDPRLPRGDNGKMRMAIDSGVSCDIQHCHIYVWGGRRSYFGICGEEESIAMTIASANEVTIANNTFKSFDRCAVIDARDELDVDDTLTRITITDNVFERASRHPIVVRTGNDRKSEVGHFGEYIINGNTGDSVENNAIFTPNEIHHEFRESSP